MKKSSKMMFFIMIIMSTMITISSNSWMSMWMGLEMNMMAFIPLIYKMKNNKSAESSMIYFLTQSSSSMIMLFSISMNSMMENNMIILLMISLMIKMGAAPFQMWFTEMMNKMSWMNCLILMTWQKMAPMFMLSNISSKMVLMSSMLSTIIGAIGGLNQTSTRKIMAFSSINHMGWMMMCTTFNNNLWMMYLLIYSTLMAPLAWMFNKKMIMHSSQMMSTMKSMTEKMNITCLMMSMGGMPPMLGFLPKWMAINSMMSNNMYLIMVMMIMMSIITLFYYMRITLSTMMIYEVQKKWMLINENKNYYMMIMIKMNLLLTTTMMFF